MFRKISACLFLFLISCACAEASVRIQVVSADFYPQGAKFSFQFNPGKAGDFEFTLPGVFDYSTVRPIVRGSAFMRAETTERKPEPFPELKPLEKNVADKRRAVKLCEARLNAGAQAIAMLSSAVASFDMREAAGYIDSLVDKASEKRLRYELADVDMRIALEKAEKELREAEEELRLLEAGLESRRLNNAAIIVVKGTSPGGEPILFEAYAYDAGWSARYDINLDGETGLVDAVMFASVRQKTGFDVEGEFSLHTRAPSFAIEPPNLLPLPVRLAGNPAVMRQQKTMNMAMDDIYYEAAPEAAMAMPAPDMYSTTANISLKANGKIKSDGVAAEVLLGKFEFASAPQLVSIPEQNREAWIVASLDTIPETLLPGAADLYVDGAASGRTYIPDIGLQGALPFGMAQRVTAEKKRVVSKTGSTWLGLGKGTLLDGYTIEVTNNMDAEREVEVRDRIPLPADDKITLENVKIDPAADRDGENKLTWKLTLKPGEKQKISVEYTLRYPSDETLVYR